VSVTVCLVPWESFSVGNQEEKNRGSVKETGKADVGSESEKS
jgi:hypothetical protein